MICDLDNFIFHRVSSICSYPISPDCFFTSILILSVGLFKSFFNPNTWNSAVIFVGLTSLLHHSRLHAWYIYDSIRHLDNFAVIFITILGFYKLNYKKLWFLITVYCFLIFLSIFFDLFDSEYVPIIHSTTHFGLITATLIDDF